MSLRIRQLRLIAQTEAGTFGRDVSFANGLNVIRADNTQGKSTVVMSIIFALGLEAMIDPHHDVPLPPAMTESLMDADGTEHAVSESFVMLEVENGSGERLTCQRWARHQEKDVHLIRTWRGAALSSPAGSYEQQDFFVRRAGAAVSERGFHFMLADFLGWELPLLLRDEGNEVPLYLEMIFPLLYVEQKRGWGGIQATMPSYGIPNARRRAIEFILGLSAYQRVRERSELLAELDRFRNDYKQRLSEFRGRLDGSGVVMQGLDPDLPTRWPAVEPKLMTAADENWEGLDRLLYSLRSRYRVLTESEIPSAEEAADELEGRLRASEHELSLLASASSSVQRTIALDDDQLSSLSMRIEALDEDRRRYRDALTLQSLGADDVDILDKDECPACHRPLPTALVAADLPPPMSLEANQQFIAEQIDTFKLMRDDTGRHRETEAQRLAAVRERMDELRQEVRGIRATLVSPSGSPSVAAVREQLRLEDRVERLEELERDFNGLLEGVRPIVTEAAEVRARLLALPSKRLDETDDAKLEAVQQSVVSQLTEYKFKSFAVNTIGISRDNYLPTREGFDLGFVTSASDAIRIVWAYLLGLLEVARTFSTNHPGLLIFDEPRQQSADPLSFEALLRRAARVDQFDQQVLFATSEPEATLTDFLDGLTYSKTSFDGMALQPTAQ